MNPYSPSIVSGNSTDTTNTRAFLQQAVDHYPRLVVFCFTLTLPYRESMADYRSLILRFHTEVWQRIGEYSWQRQLARRHLPPERDRPRCARLDGFPQEGHKTCVTDPAAYGFHQQSMVYGVEVTGQVAFNHPAPRVSPQSVSCNFTVRIA